MPWIIFSFAIFFSRRCTMLDFFIIFLIYKRGRGCRSMGAVQTAQGTREGYFNFIYFSFLKFRVARSRKDILIFNIFLFWNFTLLDGKIFYFGIFSDGKKGGRYFCLIYFSFAFFGQCSMANILVLIFFARSSV